MVWELCRRILTLRPCMREMDKGNMAKCQWLLNLNKRCIAVDFTIPQIFCRFETFCDKRKYKLSKRPLLIIYFIYSSMYMLMPNSSFILCPASPLVTVSLFSMWVYFCFVNKFIYIIFFLDSAYKWYQVIFVFLWLTSPSMIISLGPFYCFFKNMMQAL